MLLKLLMPSVGFSFKTYGELLQNIRKSRHLSATEFPGIFIPLIMNSKFDDWGIACCN